MAHKRSSGGSHRSHSSNRASPPQYPEFRSPCPVASGLDLVGDKWTLVVLRTMFAGATRYNELLGMAEGIATNILADRLAKLEQYGLIGKEAYQQNPVRYRYWLTESGADMLPILQALARWSRRHIPARWDLPEWFAAGTPDAFVGPDAKSPK